MSAFDLTLEPKVATVRRLEVLSGDARAAALAGGGEGPDRPESLEHGAVVSAVARRHGLRPQQLFTWRRLARTGRLAPPKPVRFVPVVAEAGPGRAAAPGPDSPARAGVIEIELGGAIVRVGAGVDEHSWRGSCAY